MTLLPCHWMSCCLSGWCWKAQRRPLGDEVGHLRHQQRCRAHGSDNKPVANVADGCRRIEPDQIVSGTVRESTARLWLLQLAVGIVASFITLIATVDFLGLWVFLTSIVVGAVTAWAANGKRLLQLGAEMAAFSLRLQSRSSNFEPVWAKDVEPGDWVCTPASYRRALEDAERKDRLNGVLVGRRQAAPRPPKDDNSGDLRLATKHLSIPVQRVFVARKSSGGKEISLTFARDAATYRHDETFQRRDPKARKPTNQAIQGDSQVLINLLAILDQRRSMTEYALTRDLARFNPGVSLDGVSVDRALRAAISQGMIDQEAGLGWFFREVCAIFSPSTDAALRRKREVSLSRAGKAWTRCAEQGDTRKGDSRAPRAESAPNPANNSMPRPDNQGVPDQMVDESGSRSVRGQNPAQKNPGAAKSRSAEIDDDDRGRGFKMGWSAGVSATGGTLAGLVLNGQAAWERAIFISLVFISGGAFLMLILTGLPYLTYRRRRPGATVKSDTAYNTDQSDRGPN